MIETPPRAIMVGEATDSLLAALRGGLQMESQPPLQPEFPPSAG